MITAKQKFKLAYACARLGEKIPFLDETNLQFKARKCLTSRMFNEIRGTGNGIYRAFIDGSLNFRSHEIKDRQLILFSRATPIFNY